MKWEALAGMTCQLPPGKKHDNAACLYAVIAAVQFKAALEHVLATFKGKLALRLYEYIFYFKKFTGRIIAPGRSKCFRDPLS